MKITCPVCKNITTWEENPFRPFCSERCKLIDLGAWASGEYKLPGKPADESDQTGKEDEEDNN